MPHYAAKARQQFDKDNDGEKLVRTVWSGIQNYARDSRVVERATKAFVHLAKKAGKGSWVNGEKDIGIKYKQKRATASGHGWG